MARRMRATRHKKPSAQNPGAEVLSSRPRPAKTRPQEGRIASERPLTEPTVHVIENHNRGRRGKAAGNRTVPAGPVPPPRAGPSSVQEAAPPGRDRPMGRSLFVCNGHLSDEG